jgi:hypothetical protein
MGTSSAEYQDWDSNKTVPREDATMNHLKPEHPEDAGVKSRVPDLSHTEGAELLANESRDFLNRQGFTDEEIEEWAHTYIADERSGDVTSFVEWIMKRERDASQPSAAPSSTTAPGKVD